MEELDFVAKAAKAFDEHIDYVSFTDGEIKPGCKIALRWGIGNDCVLVLKLDDYTPPVIYQQEMKKRIHYTATTSTPT